MENKQSIISGKAEIINQITVNGVQMSDVASFVELNIQSLRNELIANSRYINLILEKKILETSNKINKKLSISDLGTFRFYVKLLETYSDRPDAELANILCDLLSNSLPSEKGSILRASLTEAIDTARLLNKSQMKLLAFIFLLRNCNFTKVTSTKTFEIFIREILWRFYPTGLSSQILPKHLEYSKCTTFVAREMLISRMLTNTYLPAIQHEENISISISELLSSCTASLNSNAVPEASRLSRQVFGLHNLDKKYAPTLENSGHHETRKGNDEHKDIEKQVINIIKSCHEGEKTYVEWAMSPIKNHVLTPVGMVLAISTIRNEFGYDFNYEMWIN